MIRKKKYNLKYVVITGASGGLGGAFAKKFAELGYCVILTGRSEQALLNLSRQLQENFRCRTEIFVCDLTQSNACTRLHEFCMGKDIEIFVNNAGAGAIGYFDEQSFYKNNELLAINAAVPQTLMQLFSESIRQGMIINIASTAAYMPEPGMAVYAAAKAYLVRLSEAVSYEWQTQRKKIRLITVCPGPLLTRFDESAGGMPAYDKNGLRGIFMMSPEKCVKDILKQIAAGKTRIIPGIANRFLVLLSKCIPNPICLSFQYRIQMQKRNKYNKKQENGGRERR